MQVRFGSYSQANRPLGHAYVVESNFVMQVKGPTEEQNMELGAFSVSLNVSDLAASKDFYEKLGFQQIAGDTKENWLILRNNDHVVGLFQGMFERNVLTFNPGWDQHGGNIDQFTDVRELQRELKKRGMTFASEADESSAGPASCMITDPDGNPILIDQHR